MAELNESFEIDGSEESHGQEPKQTKQFVCDVCSYKTKHKWNLKRHSNVHIDSTIAPEVESSAQDNTAHVCETCGNISVQI